MKTSKTSDGNFHIRCGERPGGARYWTIRVNFVARVSVDEPELKFPVTAMLYVPAGVPVPPPPPPAPRHTKSAPSRNTPALPMQRPARTTSMARATKAPTLRPSSGASLPLHAATAWAVSAPVGASVRCVISCQNGNKRDERIEASRIPAFLRSPSTLLRKRLGRVWPLGLWRHFERAGGLFVAGYCSARSFKELGAFHYASFAYRKERPWDRPVYQCTSLVRLLGRFGQ
jgi:hypothetical protein